MTKITHYPKGLNPHKDLGTQRVPYLPTQGDKVTVGARIADYDDSDDIYIVLNNDISEKTAPVRIDKKKNEAYVVFDIGSFNTGQTINYQIYCGDQKSEIFEFSIYMWQLLETCTLENKANKVVISSGLMDLDLYLYSKENKLLISQKDINGDAIDTCDFGLMFGENLKVSIKTNPLSISVYINEMIIIENMQVSVMKVNGRERYKIEYGSDNKGIYGLGERFDSVNQAGKKPKNIVVEEFTMQDKITYFPVPLFYNAQQYGVFIDTYYRIDFDFKAKKTIMEMDGFDDIYIIDGPVSEVIKAYTDMTGQCKLPPKWAFGPWISANRWNCQTHIDEQTDLIKKYNYPTSVIVIEAWSDEATFYIFNDAKYEPKNDTFVVSDFTYEENSRWPDPKGMVEALHDMDIKVVLWQIAALSKLDEATSCTQHDIDCEHAVKNDYVIKHADGTLYTIPEFWFNGSYIPDFSNPAVSKWWMDKRKYLLDMGVDGFKTDGAEFIYLDDVVCADGKTGLEYKNKYSYDYEKTYGGAMSDDLVLFSRAGYKGVQRFPVHWSGDQQSLFSEYRDQIKAGLSLGLSGVPFYGFDIAGFAGKMPTAELYKRSTAMSVFAPIMQWHSEPTTGQFEDIIKGDGGINDRSPWNIASYCNDESVLDISLYYANMRMNLLPYIYDVAMDCAKYSKPMMRHLLYDYPNDENVLDIDDQFMLGDFMVAPIVYEGQTTRDVYFPNGEWINLFTGKSFVGEKLNTASASVDEIPVYIKKGSAIALNLNDDFELGKSVGNRIKKYKNLCFFITGEKGDYQFSDEQSLTTRIHWADGSVDIESKTNDIFYIISREKINGFEAIKEALFCGYKVNIYQINI